MGRVAMMELLSTDATLNALGINANHIWPNFALDISPRQDGIFLILRWGGVSSRFGDPGGTRSVRVWAYQAIQLGTDYANIDKVLGAVTDLLTGTIHYTGTDGSAITAADFRGYSEDLKDQGYDAIARNAEFTVLCRDP